MEKRQVDIDMALHQFGQRLREGARNLEAARQKSLETARAAVREQWEKEQEMQKNKAAGPEPDREADHDKGMDMER